MPDLKKMYESIIQNMGVPDLTIPCTCVKFYRGQEEVPPSVLEFLPSGLTLTSCQAKKQAGLGDAVCLTRETIGCVAAAITFGLVDPNDDTPLKGPRVYTDIMKEQSGKKEAFEPPTPKDFTEGRVYACKAANRPDFALFGPDDVGRYKDPAVARKAIADMLAIQPADTKAVFLFPCDMENVAHITPDVVVMSVRPVELTRLIQAYQFNTGKRVTASMGGVRVVNSDLIVRPYLTQEINISTYCIGARLIAQYEAERMGMGMPYKDFEIIVKGMADSKTGYPFHLYPGAQKQAF